MRQAIILLFIICFASSFNRKPAMGWQEKSEDPSYVHRAMKELTDVMVHDIYSPPVASRTYAYASIAGYEAARGGYPAYKSLAGQLHGLQKLPVPKPEEVYSYTLAAVTAILAVSKAMVVSEGKIDEFSSKMMQEFKDSGMPAAVFDNSIAFGKQIAEAILAWASTDNYKQTRSFPKYAVTSEPSSWKPTPPAYMKAVEPHWNSIRPFLLDSAKQFVPLPPAVFSFEKSSQFYREAAAVRDISLKLTQEQKDIANFWDCNPFKMNVNGHVMYASKKISPGGHWINITRLACQQRSADVMQSLEAYAVLATTLADAFISCWDEKYRSNVIRPETYINQYIDASWMPLLQTPPFPEHTSGHSVVSAAAAIILENLFGKGFSYSDSTESEFGIPPRHFTSFTAAANEAAISRFYGGIHYMPSINNGLEEGRRIGQFFVQRLATRIVLSK